MSPPTTKSLTWAVLLILINLSLWANGASDVAAPAPSIDCTSALLGLADCLTYAENGSNLAKPEGSCCSGLRKIVKHEVSCLCEALKGSQNFGVTLNITKALTLPSVCKVKTPPFSKCNIAFGGAPTEAPASSPIAGGPTGGVTGGVSAVPAHAPASSLAIKSTAPIVTLVAAFTLTLVSYYFV